jgi:hypothetical protein
MAADPSVVVVSATAEEVAVPGTAGAAIAAAVEDVAAIAAAAIASGALGLLVAEAVAGVLVGATLTWMTVAITFAIATGVPPCCGVAVESVEPAEPLSVDALAVDLSPLDGVVPDFASVGCAALPLEAVVAVLELSGCAALPAVLSEFAGGGGA